MVSELARGNSFDGTIDTALAILGQASGVDRVYIFRNHTRESDSALLTSQIHEWVRSGIEPQQDKGNVIDLEYFPSMAEVHRALSAGNPVVLIAEEQNQDLRDLLEGQDIKSLALVPIEVSGQFWGFLGFDDCRAVRKWTPELLHMLKAASAAIGGTIERSSAESAVVEANAALQLQAEELRRIQRITVSLMEDAKAAQCDAARASAAKSEFLAVMSHEMRTPLNGILGFADILGQESDPQVLRETAGIIRESGRILLNLISDVLDFSKIESGHLELDPSPVEIRPLLSEVLTAISGSAMEKGIVVEANVEREVPMVVTLDDNRLRQILINIIGNAVKFTEEGSIKVRLQSEPIDAESCSLSFEIEDTGIGIDQVALEHIFDPFDQADRTVHRRFGGTGLGLSISRSLTRMMGGDLGVRSALGNGSTFFFNVRGILAQEGKVGLRRPVSDKIPVLASECPLRILIVDDVHTNRLLAARLLSKMGYEAELVASGEEAVEITKANNYDLILMDVFMPGIDGCEATAEIRRNEVNGSHRAAILGLSADVMLENRKRCVEAGMDGFLPKPIRIPDFVEAVRKSSTQPNVRT